jgi:carboxypeptidase C (cathepsin A)
MRHTQQSPADEPLLDTTPYGSGPSDSITDATESAAVTHHTVKIGDTTISYTARAGHLVTTGESSTQPVAKIFYVAFAADGAAPSTRPVTFFYNGGPGSSSVFLLLGSFGPRRIKTSLPNFTPPAPYSLEDNPDTLLDCTDLVFINPVGTGYSTAITPKKNKNFWGVDEDARSIKQFVKRYLTVFDRWNSPKFLFGESYGTPRTCVLTWLLHEDGIDLNGVVLQSSILDYSQRNNPIGLLPTLAADALHYGKVTVSPAPPDLPTFMEEVIKFARDTYGDAIAAYPQIDNGTLRILSEYLGIPPAVLTYWGLDIAVNSTAFLTGLLWDCGLALGSYDGRATSADTGIASPIIQLGSGANDPTITDVGGVYTVMWNVYLNEELKFTSTSPFTDLNDQAFKLWNFGHVDPTGAQKGGDQGNLYTTGDLAAAMALNPYLKVFSANGYYDAVTPFFQTILNFENMPLTGATREAALSNITVRNYCSGHMIYLDGKSRTAMKADLAKFYESTKMDSTATTGATAEVVERPRLIRSRGTRRISRTPY